MEETIDTGASGLSDALLLWYDKNRRSLPWRDDPSPYHVWVSEIMLQQTRVEAVKGYYARFLQRFPDIRSLAEAPEDVCLKLWEGLGYYSRARNLQKAAKQILEEHGGQMPGTAKALQKLAGIGPYTSAAIASIAFGERTPAVDGNLLRIFARLALYEEDIRTPAAAAAARDFFLRLMPPDRPGDFNQALMDLGSMICTPGEPACQRTPEDSAGPQPAVESACQRTLEDSAGPQPAVEPACQRTPEDSADPQPESQAGSVSAAFSRCPLAPFCLALPALRCADLPVMPAKKPRTIERRTVLVILDHDRVLLQRRPSRGLLAGLYEFPNIEEWLDEQEALEKARTLLAGYRYADPDAHAFSCDSLHLRPLPEARHVFTHKEWHMRGYEIRVGSLYALRNRNEAAESPAPGGTPGRGKAIFAPLCKLQEKYAIPSAFAAYMPHQDF